MVRSICIGFFSTIIAFSAILAFGLWRIHTISQSPSAEHLSYQNRGTLESGIKYIFPHIARKTDEVENENISLKQPQTDLTFDVVLHSLKNAQSYRAETEISGMFIISAVNYPDLSNTVSYSVDIRSEHHGSDHNFVIDYNIDGESSIYQQYTRNEDHVVKSVHSETFKKTSKGKMLDPDPVRRILVDVPEKVHTGSMKEIEGKEYFVFDVTLKESQKQILEHAFTAYFSKFGTRGIKTVDLGNGTIQILVDKDRREVSKVKISIDTMTLYIDDAGISARIDFDTLQIEQLYDDWGKEIHIRQPDTKS